MIACRLAVLLVSSFVLPMAALRAQAPSAQADPPEIVLTGTISPEMLGTHKMVSFTMPAGMQRMNVELESPGFRKGMYVTVGMFDPERYRGEGRSSFSISTVIATGPYVAGPLVAGEWKVAIGYNWVAPDAHGEWKLHIRLSRQLDPQTYPVLNPRSGWYKGDLHSHTGNTDAVCKSQSGKDVPCPPSKLLEAASKQGLNFLAVTDHNTPVTFNQLANEQPYYDKLLLIAGEEVTTVRGHANVWGTLAFLDYRVADSGFTANSFFDQVHAQKALVSINHAYWPYDGRCPGCGWGWAPVTDWSKLDAMEVINGYHEKGSWFTPPAGNGIPLWEQQLAKGLRPTGVGGGDEHRGGEQLAMHDGVGIPTTVVYARELSQPAILAGIKAGHVYIQTTGPNGPDILLQAGDAIVGDEIRAATGSEVIFVATTHDQTSAKLRLLVDGQPVSPQPQLQPAGDLRRAEYRWHSDGKRHWVRVELDGGQPDPLALTNPIYVNWR